MDKVFPIGHQDQSIGLVPGSLLEICCKMDWFRLIFRLIEAYFACYKAIATYFICLAVCSWISCGCFAVEIQKSNSNSKRCSSAEESQRGKG